MITVKNLLLIGDSKFAATGNGSYNPRLCSALSNKYPNQLWRETPSKMAVGGRTVATTQDNIDTFLSSAVGIPDLILINLGANDCDDSPVKASWQADLNYIFNACHTLYVSTPIFYNKVWRLNYDSECLLLWDWALEIIVSKNYCYQGIDEFVALKGSDDGTTNTIDGTHPNDLGIKASVLEYMNVL